MSTLEAVTGLRVCEMSCSFFELNGPGLRCMLSAGCLSSFTMDVDPLQLQMPFYSFDLTQRWGQPLDTRCTSESFQNSLFEKTLNLNKELQSCRLCLSLNLSGFIFPFPANFCEKAPAAAGQTQHHAPFKHAHYHCSSHLLTAFAASKPHPHHEPYLEVQLPSCSPFMGAAVCLFFKVLNSNSNHSNVLLPYTDFSAPGIKKCKEKKKSIWTVAERKLRQIGWNG